MQIRWTNNRVRSRFTETSNALTSIPAGGRCECEAVVERLRVATVEGRLRLAD